VGGGDSIREGDSYGAPRYIRPSLLRPDGHPGPHMGYHPFHDDKNAEVQNDCPQLCLLGPIDAWNDLMVNIIQNAGNCKFPSSE